MNASVMPICHVSVPRSGHHMLASILGEVFEWGQFIHCETYYFPRCCRNVPCTRVAARAVEAFGSDRALRLYLQKSHDMFNELSVQPAQRFIVQLRHPLQATIGWLRWHRSPIGLHEVGQSSVGFLVYYLRFFNKWMANERLPSVFRLRYEDLVSEPERQVRALLDWTGVAFEEVRLKQAVQSQAGVDAHTGQPRKRGTSLYRAKDYLPLFGPLYARLLPRLAKFCPGLPYDLGEWSGPSGPADEVLDEWIFTVDLRRTREWRLDLSDAGRVVDHPSIQGQRRIPHAFGFGFSAPETPHGCWTDGDVCIVPFRCPVGAQGVQISLEYRRTNVQFDGLDLELVVEGHRCPVQTDLNEATMDGGRRETRFALGSEVPRTMADGLEGCLILKFVNLVRVDNAVERRKLGLLLTSIGFALVDSIMPTCRPDETIKAPPD